MKTLELMSFDVNKQFSPEMVGRFISDRTQFRTGPAHKPLWAQSSEWGKFAWQYKTFAYHHGMFVKDLFKMALKQGNPKPLITFLVSAGVAGELLTDVRSALRGKDVFPENDDLPYDSDDQIELALHALFDRSNRIPLSHPVWRYVQNFSMIGGFGAAQDLVGDQVRFPDAAGTLLGAGASNAVDFMDKAAMKGPEGVAEWGIEQVPIWGYQLSDMFKDRDESDQRQRGSSRSRGQRSRGSQRTR